MYPKTHSNGIEKKKKSPEVVVEVVEETEEEEEAVEEPAAVEPPMTEDMEPSQVAKNQSSSTVTVLKLKPFSSNGLYTCYSTKKQKS